MEGTEELIIVAAVVLGLLAAGLMVVWLVIRRHHVSSSAESSRAGADEWNEELQHELHEEAHDELEEAVKENAAFIQRDVRRTTSELSGYMQQEIARTLDEEMTKFSQSTGEIEKVAANSITRMQQLLDERYAQLSARVDEESAREKDRLVKQFEENMTDVVSYDVTQALGDHLDVSSQLDYILKELENNKAAIVEDIKNG